jgi:hypothetical protein
VSRGVGSVLFRQAVAFVTLIVANANGGNYKSSSRSKRQY